VPVAVISAGVFATTHCTLPLTPQPAPPQVILSHTPFKDLAPRLGSHPILAVGRKDTQAVAQAYGFQKVMSTYQLAAALPDALPFGAAGVPASEWSCLGAELGGGLCFEGRACSAPMSKPSDHPHLIITCIKIQISASSSSSSSSSRGAGAPRLLPSVQ